MSHPPKLLRLALLAAVLCGVAPATAAAAPGSIRGHVEARADGRAVSDFAVELYDASRVQVASLCTDIAGDYGFLGLGAGQYYVQFSGDPKLCSDRNYAPAWFDSHGPAEFADPITLTDGLDRSDINASLFAGTRIRGTVREPGAAKGLARISVRVFDVAGSEVRRVCTNEAGAYATDRLLGGTYAVQFVADGTCGAVTPYPSRWYENSATLQGARAVNAGNAEDIDGIDGLLSLVPTHAVTVTVSGAGSVSGAPGGLACPGSCAASFAEGNTLTLTATAQAGSRFTGWSGACAGLGDCILVLTNDKTVGATFAPVAGAGGGGAAGGSPAPAPASNAVPLSTAVTAPVVAAGPSCTIAPASKVRAGKWSVTVTCDRSSKLALTGTVRFRRGKKTTTVKLSGASVTATKKTIRIKLPVKAAAALRAKLRLSASLRLVATSAAGTSTTTLAVKRLK